MDTSRPQFALRPIKADPLTKSKYVHGLQCPLYVWLEVRTDAPRPETDAFTQALFDAGDEVGEYARRRWDARELEAGRPAGVRITDDPKKRAEAVASTTEALAAGARVIHEAAFTHGGVHVRVDVLEQLDDSTFAIHEVKSTGKYDKDKHLDDVAVQTWVVRGCGLDVTRSGVVHLNEDYLWPGGAYDLETLLIEHDATDAVNDLQDSVAENVSRLLAVLSADSTPSVPADAACNKPYACPYLEVCPSRGEEVEHPISELPGRTDAVEARCLASGFRSLLQMDEADAAQNLVYASGAPHETWYRTWEATRTGKRIFAEECGAWLDSLNEPIYHLDFETIAPPLPLVANTHPFEQVPLQYSLHVERSSRPLEHREFLAEATDPDPRRSLIEQMIKDLGETGTILRWSPFETTIIRALAENPAYRAFSPRLDAILERIDDLGHAVNRLVFDKDFHGRWSIKVVHPVLVRGGSTTVHDDAPVLSYDDLDGCAKGDQAAMLLAEYVRIGTGDARRQDIRKEMLTYCQLDTQAMVDVLGAIRMNWGQRQIASAAGDMTQGQQ